MFETEIIFWIIAGFATGVVFCMAAAPDAVQFRKWEREQE